MFKKNKKTRNAKGSFAKQTNFSYRSLRREQARRFERGKYPKKRQSKNVLLNRLLISSICIFLLFLGFYLSLVKGAPKVSFSGENINQEDKAQLISFIESNHKNSLRNKFKFSYDKNDLASSVKEENSQVTSVNTSFSMFSPNPHVEVILAHTAAVLSSGEELYALDGNGRALYLIKDKTNASISDVPTVTDPSLTPIEVGNQALTNAQINYVRIIYLQSKEKGIKITSIELSDGGYGMHVWFNKNKYYVKFSFHSDPRVSIGSYFALKERLDKEGSTPASYIDVRLPQKIYVK